MMMDFHRTGVAKQLSVAHRAEKNPSANGLRKESKKRKTTVVMLLPVSTDSEWFKENIYHQKGVTIRFLPERVKFENPTVPSWVNGNKSGSAGAMRPSMIVIFKGNKKAFKVE